MILMQYTGIVLLFRHMKPTTFCWRVILSATQLILCAYASEHLNLRFESRDASFRVDGWAKIHAKRREDATYVLSGRVHHLVLVARIVKWGLSPPGRPLGRVADGEMKNYDVAFARLKKSKFRSRFHLSAADRKYIAEKGIDTIRSHCEDFIRTRLAPAEPPNDGKQTPMRGHPVFKAQHACACCCRDCLAKWWKVPRGVAIPAERQQGIVDFLMFWIEREMGLRRL